MGTKILALPLLTLESEAKVSSDEFKDNISITGSYVNLNFGTDTVGTKVVVLVGKISLTGSNININLDLSIINSFGSFGLGNTFNTHYNTQYTQEVFY